MGIEIRYQADLQYIQTLFPHQLELVSDLIAIPQPPTNGIADGEALALRHDLVVGGAQGGDLAPVDVLRVALERRDLVREVSCLFLLSKKPDLRKVQSP